MQGRRGGGAALPSFKAQPKLAAAVRSEQENLGRAISSRNRLLLKRARDDQREWVVKRRERTRHLIELGGLVAKAGLVELTDDDRATLYGAFLATAVMLRSEQREEALVSWQRRGRRAFESESEARNAASSASL